MRMGIRRAVRANLRAHGIGGGDGGASTRPLLRPVSPGPGGNGYMGGAIASNQAVAVPVRNTAALAVAPQREQALGEPAALPRGGFNFHRMVGLQERGFSIRS